MENDSNKIVDTYFRKSINFLKMVTTTFGTTI